MLAKQMLVRQPRQIPDTLFMAWLPHLSLPSTMLPCVPQIDHKHSLKQLNSYMQLIGLPSVHPCLHSSLLDNTRGQHWPGSINWSAGNFVYQSNTIYQSI